MENATYNNIVPDHLQAEFIQMSDDDLRSSFRTGDAVFEVYADNKARGLKISKGDVHRAIAAFRGKSARRIREFATVAKFYPPSVREEYGILSFEHFTIAMRIGDKWQESLEWAISQTEILGRPATVDAMLANYQSQMNRLEEDEDLSEQPIVNIGPHYAEIKAFSKKLKTFLVSTFSPHDEIYIEGFAFIDRLEEEAEKVMEEEKAAA